MPKIQYLMDYEKDNKAECLEFMYPEGCIKRTESGMILLHLNGEPIQTGDWIVKNSDGSFIINN